MTSNLIQLLQEKLNCPPLQKIDPNTQDIAVTGVDEHPNKLMQAVIPSVLTGFYKLTRSREGAALLLGGNISTTWVETLFADNKEAVISNIAAYAGTGEPEVSRQIGLAAAEASSIIKTNASPGTVPTEDSITLFMKNERNNILHYLPAALQIGGLLNDTTLDDHTNKMDGPVSGLMHSIEKIFSGSPPAPEELKK
jgi:hypothetical protein